MRLIPSIRTTLIALALYSAGAGSLYLAGPMIGRQMQRTGAHLVGLGGDVGFVTAQEAKDFVDAVATDVVAERAKQMLARPLPPTTISRR